MNTERIRKNLTELRMMHGLTQAELAEAAGVTTNHISHVENGSRGISLELVLKTCQTLGITPNDLLAGEYGTEEKGDGHALSLDSLEPSDRNLMQKIAYYMEHRNN